jgi:hypothetical protein
MGEFMTTVELDDLEIDKLLHFTSTMSMMIGHLGLKIPEMPGEQPLPEKFWETLAAKLAKARGERPPLPNPLAGFQK